MQERNRGVQRIPTSTRLEPEVRKELAREAKAKGIGLSELIADLLRRHVATS